MLVPKSMDNVTVVVITSTLLFFLPLPPPLTQLVMTFFSHFGHLRPCSRLFLISPLTPVVDTSQLACICRDALRLPLLADDGPRRLKASYHYQISFICSFGLSFYNL